MSVPLPNLPTEEHLAPASFLDPDERFEIFQVKAAERPHLLALSYNDESDLEDNGDPPLLDGCDIPAWRQEGLAGPLSPGVLGALRIGAGSSLFRRDSQWPCLLNRPTCTPWDALREMLLLAPFDAIPRVDAHEMTQSVNGNTRFAVEWEERNLPVLIENCATSWKAMPKYEADNENANFWNGGGNDGWTFESLVKRFGDITWRFSDTHGEMMSLKTYAKYISNPEGLTDDSPLAIYDSEFGNDSPTNVLLQEYSVPACFSPDLFSLANSEARPPFRWILIGPARSGTGLHIDPLWTNAWVTLLQGRKRWLLFPPETPPELIAMDRPQIPSSIWFSHYYDLVTKKAFPRQPVHVLQHPGETVFVPSSWPHLVLNLDLTVAVTHNYASEFGPFEDMWKEVVTEEPGFAADWFAGLKKHRPDLAERIEKSHPDTVPKDEILARRRLA